MNLGIVAYLPPPRVGHPDIFLKNLGDFPPANPLFYYSDHPWPVLSAKVPNPEQAKTTRNPWAFKNLIFLLGLQVAISRKLTHFIYLEEDSRVGKDGWDRVMFDEFFAQPGLAMAGSLVCFNPFNSGVEAGRRFSDLIAKHNSTENFPVATFLPVQSFGAKAIPDAATPCLFPMGSLAIYETEEVQSLFEGCEMVSTAKAMEPWDKEIGLRMWKAHGLAAFDKIGVLRTIYSSYGNAVTTEVQRREMLSSGKLVAVHQIKGGWTPPVAVPKPVVVPGVRPDLSRVTLYACCWSDANDLLERTARVLRYCQKLFTFKETVYFCHRKPATPLDARLVQIPPLTSMGQWNIFVNRIIPEFLTGDFAMSVHEDGFPIQPDLWDNRFLDYDYIGAPWKDGVVGNGGFNLESRRLLQLKTKLPFCGLPPRPSDYWICRDNRKVLEDQGVKFAPKELALQFSTETVGGERSSFGFHGRNNKYGKGWERIKEREKGIGKVDLVYIFVLDNPKFLEKAKQFVSSYIAFPPQHPHDTIVVCNNGIPNQEEMDIFKPLPGVRFLHHDNSGYDIGGFIAAAKQSVADMMVCFGADVHFWREGWLDRMVQAKLKHGPGVYGGTTSFQEMPHLNSTGFWCDPILLASYPWPVVSKEDRYSFEQNKHQIDRPFWLFVLSLGKRALLVTWDGEYEWQDWRKPPNIFRRGNQSNMLFHWKWSDHWQNLNPGEKDWVSFVTDTLTLDPFRPGEFPKEVFLKSKTQAEKDWIHHAFREFTLGRSTLKNSQNQEHENQKVTV